MSLKFLKNIPVTESMISGLSDSDDPFSSHSPDTFFVDQPERLFLRPNSLQKDD